MLRSGQWKQNADDAKCMSKKQKEKGRRMN
jgi:hypothetical protein